MNLADWIEEWTRKLQRNLHDDKKFKLHYAIAELDGSTLRWLHPDGTFGGLAEARRFTTHIDVAEEKFRYYEAVDRAHGDVVEQLRLVAAATAWWRAHPIVPILTSGSNFADFPTEI